MGSAEVEYRCFVGGLAWATDSQSLENAFSPYGEIIESKVRLSPQRSDLAPMNVDSANESTLISRSYQNLCSL